MADGIVEYAMEVKNLLKSIGVDAEFSYVPDYSLPDTLTKRCVVVPINVEQKIIGRAVVEKTFRVDIAVLYKVKNHSAVSDLVKNVETIADSLIGRKVLSGACVGADFSPLYAADMLLQNNLFVGIISSSIKVAK